MRRILRLKRTCSHGQHLIVPSIVQFTFIVEYVRVCFAVCTSVAGHVQSCEIASNSDAIETVLWNVALSRHHHYVPEIALCRALLDHNGGID
jgi:hypothetical protein